MFPNHDTGALLAIGGVDALYKEANRVRGRLAVPFRKGGPSGDARASLLAHLRRLVDTIEVGAEFEKRAPADTPTK